MDRKKTPEELLEEIQDFYYLAGINHAISVINGQERYKDGWNEGKDNVWLALQDNNERIRTLFNPGSMKTQDEVKQMLSDEIKERDRLSELMKANLKAGESFRYKSVRELYDASMVRINLLIKILS